MQIHTDVAYGIIPLRRQGQEWEVFIVQHNAGHWSFPKGHAEPGETPQQTAERELYEETGLVVQQYVAIEPLKSEYNCVSHGRHVSKTVILYGAYVYGDIQLQQEEIQHACWSNFEHAKKLLNFVQMQQLVDTLAHGIDAL